MLPAACGESGPPEGVATATRFCEEALAGVERYMATVESPASGTRGGTVVVGATADMDGGMMALTTADYNGHQHQVFLNLMTLVRYDERLDPVPYLAESWAWSEDGTELTFRLRDDVVWHDGVPTTARDVEFTYLRATDSETTFANPTYFQSYQGVEVLDERTIRFRMRPHAEPLDTWRAVPIMPAHLLADVPPAELRAHPYGSVCPVGNGPFRFVSHAPSGSWTFAANPAFPEALGGRPSVDRYVYRIVPDPSTLLTELLNENVDVYVSVRPDQAGAIEAAEGTRLLNFPARDYTFIAWNSTRAPLGDPALRRALTMALDRQGMVDGLLSGMGTVANSGVPTVHWAFDPENARALGYDPAGAASALTSLGWEDRDGDGVRENAEGQRLSFTLKFNPESELRQTVAELSQAQFAAVGVEAIPVAVEFSQFLQDILGAERNYDAFVLTFSTDFRVDDRDLFHSGSSDASYAWSRTRNLRIDRLIDTLQTVVDQEDAIAVWREYQAAVLEEQPFSYLFYPDRIVGLSSRVENVAMDARGEWVGVVDWTIPPDRRKYATPGRP